MAFSPVSQKTKAWEMKTKKKNIIIDSTVLLCNLLSPLFFPPVYSSGRRLCILQPTHRPPFCLAIAGKILSPPSPPLNISPSSPPNIFQCDCMHCKKLRRHTPLFVPTSCFSVTCGGQNESRQKNGCGLYLITVIFKAKKSVL